MTIRIFLCHVRALLRCVCCLHVFRWQSVPDSPIEHLVCIKCGARYTWQ